MREDISKLKDDVTHFKQEMMVCIYIYQRVGRPTYIYIYIYIYIGIVHSMVFAIHQKTL